MFDHYSVFKINSEIEFNSKALELYKFQSVHCPIYKKFISIINRPEPKSYQEIPCLPISFFKEHMILNQIKEVKLKFKSSGTTEQKRSCHYITDPNLYEASFLKSYKQFIGNPEDQIILALLPNYIEQGESSLVYMVNELIKKSNHQSSEFVLENTSKIIDVYQKLPQEKTLVIIGVSYALLDLAKKNVDLKNAIVIETGGMKGKREELTKEDLHLKLKQGLNTNHIYSEYGMTELLSQSYSTKNQLFNAPNWKKILIRDLQDPYKLENMGETGGVNIIDLANSNSCAFIATDDLGVQFENGFKIKGRIDQSMQRGCNLLIN